MRRLRLMTTEKCSYRSSVSDAPSTSKSSMSSAFAVDRGQIDREPLAEERRVVAAAVAIVGGDRLRLGDELCRLARRWSSGRPVSPVRGEAREIARAKCSLSGDGQAGAAAARRRTDDAGSPRLNDRARRVGCGVGPPDRPAGAHVGEQLLHHVGTHRVVRGQEAAAEMQSERLPAVEVEHDRAGIAPQRRAVMQRSASSMRVTPPGASRFLL